MRRLTEVVTEFAGDSGVADRTWVQLTEAYDGGWGLAGHANTNDSSSPSAAPNSPPASDPARRECDYRELLRELTRQSRDYQPAALPAHPLLAEVPTSSTSCSRRRRRQASVFTLTSTRRA